MAYETLEFVACSDDFANPDYCETSTVHPITMIYFNRVRIYVRAYEFKERIRGVEILGEIERMFIRDNAVPRHWIAKSYIAYRPSSKGGICGLYKSDTEFFDKWVVGDDVVSAYKMYGNDYEFSERAYMPKEAILEIREEPEQTQVKEWLNKMQEVLEKLGGIAFPLTITITTTITEEYDETEQDEE